MHYRQGSYGRAFLLKFDDRDDLPGEIRRFAREPSVRVATMTLLDGMLSAGMVMGPKEPVIAEIIGVDARRTIDERTGLALRER